MSDRDKERKKAKIEHKLRWYYLHFLQKRRRLVLYPCYRHYRLKQQACQESLRDCDFYLTKAVHPGAGIGDQLASWITGYYYAGRLGVKYAHSRLYPDKWEEFFSFGAGEVRAAELVGSKGYKKIILPCFDESRDEEWKLIHNIIHSYSGSKVVFFLEQNQIYTAQYGAMDIIRTKFNHTHPVGEKNLIYRSDTLNIAVHIRRGDIIRGQMTGEQQLTQRWLDNGYYVKVLQQILPLVRDKKPEIYLFSQGEPKEFQEFEQFSPIHYCMDMPATDSFLHMVRADILITSRSSFSYKPALMSEGIRICPENFWHGYPEDEKWILADDNGIIHSEKLNELKLLKG